MKVTTQGIGNALAFLATAEPQVLETYQIIRAIWLTANPGKTEADYINMLIDKSSKTTSDSDQILTDEGFVRDPDTGAWRKGPPAPVNPTP